MEVAAKLDAYQKLAKVPLLASSDLEPALGRLEGAVFPHYLMETGGATVFRFTEASVRRALDAGRSAAECHAEARQ